MTDEVIEPEMIPPKMHRLDPRWGEVRALVRKAMPGTVAELAKTAGYDQETVKDAIAWLVERNLAREDLDEALRSKGIVRWQRVLTTEEIAQGVGAIADVSGAVAELVGRSDVGEVLHKGATAARAIPSAIEGMKREAKPALEALSDFYQTAKAKGVINTRPPYRPAIKRR